MAYFDRSKNLIWSLFAYFEVILTKTNKISISLEKRLMQVSTGPKFDAPTLDITCDDDDNFLGQYDSDNFSDDENYDDEEDDLLDDNQVIFKSLSIF